jgi:hypothetical protein
MKKQILTLLAAGATGSLFAQLPVSTAPQNKKIILEEFTGIYCGYCPDGHSIANSIYAANPGKCVLINIHTGGYANVAAGEPDLKSTMGTAIAGISGMSILGYPAGDINRVNFGTASLAQNTVTPFGMAQNRNTWTSTANTTKGQAAYCNVAVEGSVDAITRVLTYTAQVYYTANSPATSNSLTVVLLEDSVLGPQHNYGSPTLYNASNYNADGSYNHNHVLRTGLTTGNFGITIPATTTGTTFTTTGTYTIPATYGAAGKTNPCILGHIKLAAFVTESNVKTINGANGPVAITNVPNLDGILFGLVADPEVCSGNLLATKFSLSNNGSANITSAAITYSVNGGSAQVYNFSGNLAPYTQTLITLPAYSFVPNTTNTLSLVITSVNGGNDQNATNDMTAKSIPLTTKIANGLNLSMDFTQDQYGSESTWEISEEVSGTVIASGGPYADLAASGILLHSQAFSVNPNLCYKVIVNDAFGDGFNAGTGAGNYKIKNGAIIVYTMNGVMGTQDMKLFKTSITAGIHEANSLITNISVYPNPANNATSLSLDLVQNETVSINVINTVGQVMHAESLNNLSAGNHVINFNTENWASGIYNINISTTTGIINRKLVVSK